MTAWRTEANSIKQITLSLLVGLRGTASVIPVHVTSLSKNIVLLVSRFQVSEKRERSHNPHKAKDLMLLKRQEQFQRQGASAWPLSALAANTATGKEEKQAAGHTVMATIKNVDRMKTVCKMEQKSKTNSIFN